MSDLSKLPGIEDCLSTLLSYCTIEDLLTCHKLSSSWREALESRSLKKCWTSRLKKLVEDNEIILKSSRGRRYLPVSRSRYRIDMDGLWRLDMDGFHDDGFHVEEYIANSRQDWNRICYKFIKKGSIEDVIQFASLLVASLKRVERPMNREGPTEWMDPLHIAVLESDVNAVKFLLPFTKMFGKYQGKTPFILACEQKEVEIIKLFLEISGEKKRRSIFHDVDNDGKSGFMWLCYHGLTDLIRDIQFPNDNSNNHYLLGHDHSDDDDQADVNHFPDIPVHVSPSINYPRDWDGLTPLMTATMKKHCSTVELLMRKGASVNAKDKSGKTAFTLAVWVADIDMLNLYFKYAKEKSIDFNSTDDTGRTAYIYACMMKLVEIVNMFREKAQEFGINLLKKDIDGLMGSDFIEIRESQDEFDFPVELGTPQEWNALTKNERRMRLYNRELRGTQTRQPLFMPTRGPGHYQVDVDMPLRQQYYEYQGFVEEADEIDFPAADDDFHEFGEINFPAVDDPDQGFEEADEIDFPELQGATKVSLRPKQK